MADNKKEEGLNNEVKDSEPVSREISNLEQEGGSQASGQNVTGEDVQREESFAKKKKGKKGKKIKRQDDEEALERGDSFTRGKKGKGKKKSKEAKTTTEVRVVDGEHKEQIELSTLKEADITSERKVKMEATNIDNKLIQEGQEAEIIAPKEETTAKGSEQNKEQLESSGDEKKDSEKESVSDEDNAIKNTAKDENANVTDKDDGVKDSEREEIRRRPTLSELRSASAEGTDETTTVASNQVSVFKSFSFIKPFF